MYLQQVMCKTFQYFLDGTPTGMAFNDDGTKMYMVGAGNDKVYEYSLDNPSSPSVCVNEAITNITYNTTGATGIGTPTNLPTGVTAAWSSNVITISGTPTVAGTYAYSIPLTGGCGTVAATGTITVLPTESAAFSYASATYCETDSDPTPTVTGTTGGTFSATPSGLSINASTGAIDLDASTMGTYAVKHVLHLPFVRTYFQCRYQYSKRKRSIRYFYCYVCAEILSSITRN